MTKRGEIAYDERSQSDAGFGTEAWQRLGVIDGEWPEKKKQNEACELAGWIAGESCPNEANLI